MTIRKERAGADCHPGARNGIPRPRTVGAGDDKQDGRSEGSEQSRENPFRMTGLLFDQDQNNS